MTDKRLGMIGFGLRASLARYAHRPGKGSVVTVVCDTDERGRRDAEAAIPGVQTVASVEELVTHDLDGVLILTPDHLHVEHAVATLQAGIPTFLEKPVAITTEGADRILATARATGTRLYIGHNMRHMPVIRAMKDAIDAGRIGDVKAVWCRHFVSAGGDYYFKDWHADRANTTGLLLQKGAHDIDIIHWLAGGFSTSVSAVGSLAVYGDIESRRDNNDRRMVDWYDEKRNWPPTAQTDLAPEVNVEDISMVTMVLDNGVLASYQQCHFTPDYWRNYTIIGTRGRMENFGDGPGAVIKIWDQRVDSYRDTPDSVVEVPPAEGGHGGADPRLVAEFVRFATEGGPTMTSPVAARNAVAAGVAATRSLRDGGGRVDVPPLPADLVGYFADDQLTPA